MSADLAPLDHAARRSALGALLDDAGLSIAICWQQPTVCWLTGNDISGPNALVWTGADWLVVCDEYDTYNFATAAPDVQIEPYPYFGSLWAALTARLQALPGRRLQVGIEQVELRQTAWASICEAATGVDAEVVPIDDLIATVRLPKSGAEIERIRAAARCVQAAVRAMTELLRAPTTEREIAILAYRTLIDAGSDYVASQPYVKSGPRALLTHARWTNRRIEPGDHVLLELGASVDRYHASLMRTRLGQTRSADYRRAVDAVVAGRDAYLEAIRPGITAEELHETHLRVLDRFGLRAWNRHAGGYSLGIAFPPYWGEVPLLTITKGVTRTLDPPIALHLISGVLEPGAGVPHIGLSESVLLTEDGIERLVEVPDFL